VHGGDVEVWQIVNLTGDTHPIHFHLVNVQLLSRQAIFDVPVTGRRRMGTPLPFRGFNSKGLPQTTRAAIGPDPTELGWKETIKMNPGEVTTVIMKFALPYIPGVKLPNSLNSNLGINGHEYVWHCHILEHEEHDMMRPLVVQDNRFHLPEVHK
jgi:spore coat protein A, manganese oxidase